MNTFFISIRRCPPDKYRGIPEKFSVDISFEPGTGGACRQFKFLGDALIWIKEQTRRDIPASWPDLEKWDWKTDFKSWKVHKRGFNLGSRYHVTAIHGESKSVFIVVDGFASMDEQPAYIANFGDRQTADSYCSLLNQKEETNEI